MIRTASVRHWLVDNEIGMAWAAALALAAIGIPTLIRGELNDIVEGCETAAFFPFVLLAAIFLGWRWAAVVALASAMIINVYFIGPDGQFMEEACDVFGFSTFLIGSTMIIGFVEAIRLELGKAEQAESQPSGGIVFSLQDGEAWASWYGRGEPVRLGPQEDVAEMMEDFLAQLELGKRLNGQA
jgi:K+-sensing histidine kinase KdpD